MTEGWKNLDRSVGPVDSFRGGTSEALRLLDDFVQRQIGELSRKPRQARDRRYLAAVAVPAFRAHRTAHGNEGGVEESKAPQTAKDDYINQFLTWRELAINFVHFNPLYDSHRVRSRLGAQDAGGACQRSATGSVYTREQFEHAQTHDDLWNAAQLQMLHAGWMHNYMRMYWAKKILEWSPSPAVAYQTARVSERQVLSRWTRSRWLCRSGVGDRRQVRSAVV